MGTDEHGEVYHVHNCLESRVAVHVEADYGSLAYFLEESRTTQPTQPRKHGNIDLPRREGWIVLEEDRWYIIPRGGLADNPTAFGAGVGKARLHALPYSGW